MNPDKLTGATTGVLSIVAGCGVPGPKPLTDSERALEALVRSGRPRGRQPRARIVSACAEIVLVIERISGLGLSPDGVTWIADTDPFAVHDMGARWSAQARRAVVLKICSPFALGSHTAHSSLCGHCRQSGHRTVRTGSLTIMAT